MMLKNFHLNLEIKSLKKKKKIKLEILKQVDQIDYSKFKLKLHWPM